MNKQKATSSVYTTLHQIVQLIPRWMIQKIANEVGVDTRGFSVRSHIVSLMLGHISHAFSLNEICDSCSIHASSLQRIDGVTPPKRNTFSNANRTRDPLIAERLYWGVHAQLSASCEGFAAKGRCSGFLHRFKRKIFAVDSTIIRLSLACIDWAKHRRRKAAAKAHVRIDVTSFVPSVVIVEDAAHHDLMRADALCRGIRPGDILVADKGYIDFSFFHSLNERGVFFVLRQKDNMSARVINAKSCSGRILADELFELDGLLTSGKYLGKLRRVRALVEVDGQDREMTFITNNMDWAAQTITELYKARWSVEIFFKELKQTLQLADFIGTNENAVKWQIWVGLLVHLLLHYLKYQSRWRLSFSRLTGLVRSAIWMKIDILRVLEHYGTASPPSRPFVTAKQMFLQGFEPNTSRLMGQHI
jgi:Transposase DDE domain/Domain of unknown function (DUF4372)